VAAERTCQARRPGSAKAHLPHPAGSDPRVLAPGLYLGSLRTLQRRMGEWRISHAEQVVGQQMGAIRDQENSQLNSKKPVPAGRQLDG